MTDHVTRVEAHTLIGAYVLDAVTDDERRVFEEHLARCAACAQETAELRETTALLASTTTAEPPARLREQVLAAVAHTRQLPPETATASRVGWSRRAAALASAAAVVAVVAFGVQGIATNRQLEGELAALRQTTTTNSRLADLLAAPDAKVVHGEVIGGGTGTAVASTAKGQVVFLAHGLASLPGDRTYQVWLIGGDGPRSAGLLSSVDDQAIPVLADGFTGGQAVGLTVEPRGGSVLPTTPTVVVLPMT